MGGVASIFTTQVARMEYQDWRRHLRPELRHSSPGRADESTAVCGLLRNEPKGNRLSRDVLTTCECNPCVHMCQACRRTRAENLYFRHQLDEDPGDAGHVSKSKRFMRALAPRQRSLGVPIGGVSWRNCAVRRKQPERPECFPSTSRSTCGDGVQLTRHTARHSI